MATLPSQPPSELRRLEAARPGGQAAPPPPLPLTERVLGSLPGPRALWIVLWAAVPLGYMALPARIDPTVGQGLRAGPIPSEVLTASVYVYAIALSFWAARKMARDAAAAERRLVDERELEEPLSDDGRPARAAFREVGLLAPPIAAWLLVSAVGIVNAVRLEGAWSVLLWPFPLLTNLPLIAAFWTYLAVLIGLDRLGREKLRLDDAFPADPLLGLYPVGSLAFTVFLIMVAGFVPVIAVSFVSTAFLILNLVILVPGAALFFLALYRLHRQMVAVRRKHIARARDLYARAYGPVWASGDLEQWRQDSDLLRAVAEIEHRAAGISGWPFSSGVTATILGVTIGLTVTMLGRLLAIALGL